MLYMNERNRASDEMARAAAHWWRECLERSPRHDNGSKDFSSIMAGVLADSMMDVQISKEKLDAFEDILTEKLKYCREGVLYSLHCDYSPDVVLRDAADEAGIRKENFPWKTSMRMDLEKNKIYVSSGYRVPWQVIWPNENKESEEMKR